MMAYDSQHVLAILHDGSPVREINGKVTLPFHSEYKIRLKNKHPYLRTKARVWIDGRKVSNLGDFILSPGETMDLERFLDESMHSGRRFKFVPLSDRRVNDPTDHDNGVIKVAFYREVDFVNTFKITQPITPQWGPNWGTGDVWNSAVPLSGGGGNTSKSFSRGGTIGTCLSAPTFTVAETGQAGATVEGGNSNQRFVTGDDFLTETFPIALTLRIQGPKERSATITRPSKNKKAVVRYCSSCGARRMRKAKFCHRCGIAYPKLG